LTRNSSVPHSAQGWGKLLASAKHKRQLINILSEVLPGVVAPLLQKGQTLVIAGGFDTGRYENRALVLCCVDGQLIKRVGEKYISNQPKADTRTWLHELECPCSPVTIFSPDSDVLMVGLLTFPRWSAADKQERGGGRKQAYVQISRSQGEEANQPGIVDVNRLVAEIEGHTDLQKIEARRRLQCLVSLLVLTGCDLVSFFSGISKRQFLKDLFHEAHFISGTEGFTLADWNGRLRSTPASMLAAVKRAEERGQATLAVSPEFEGAAVAFLLTIGVAYFQRYKSRMGQLGQMGQEIAPRSFIMLTEGANPKDASGAERWLDKLQEHTWTAAASEEGNVPSVGALVFHFLRAVLVLRIWNAACIGWMSIPALESFGYQRNGFDGLEIVYDFQGRLKRVEEQVELVLKGCGCKKGCKTRQCKERLATTAVLDADVSAVRTYLCKQRKPNGP
jgi:hypothetical protein